MYDRQTESIWSQIGRQAIAGPLSGGRLEPLVLMHTSWSDWKRSNPHTLVMSTETGYERDYSRNPYASYDQVDEVWFPVRIRDDRYHAKEPVLGLEHSGQFRAYPFTELQQGGGNVQDVFGDRQISVHYDPAHRKAWALDEKGAPLAGITTYWFAWYAFHPGTSVFTASQLE